MRLLSTCILITALAAQAPSAGADSILPHGPEPEPVAAPHFPSSLHAFIWRNWGLVDSRRLASLLGASQQQLEGLAASLGLPRRPNVCGEMARRGYLTLIRRNWHLLPYEQILELLDWKAEELAYTLREDDFFWIKLGRLKPRCPPIRFHEPTAREKERAELFRRVVIQEFGKTWFEQEDPRFEFIKRLSRVDEMPAVSRPKPPQERPEGALSPRFLYSYFALYGDPLLEPDLDPYPDGYLQKLAAVGVDGIWLQGILRRLAPSPLFPEDGRRADERLENLRRLVERAARRGIGVFLYFNEPRAQPLAFFRKHPGLKGVQERDLAALCTSTPQVQSFLHDGVAYIFRKVPRLRGFFTITASENLTSCWSHHGGGGCPRCSKREPADVVAEVNRLMAEGARESAPGAEVIAWDWGWADAWVKPIAERLPSTVRLQSVSEWSLPIERGGIRTTAGEYSISVVGPGPRAQRNWATARKRGLPIGAKVQINNTWEISAVPYVPALDLIAEHMHRLRKTGVTSLMLGWTLGGYPSENLELASAFYGADPPEPQVALAAMAKRRYGPGAEAALRAWSIFSEAYREYPFHIGVLYRGPQQLGPANLLYGKKTGYSATMIGFPYDDLDGWRAVYPPEVFAGQFEKMAKRWKDGLRELEIAAGRTPAHLRAGARKDLDVARACRLHFASVAAQARFVLAREAYRAAVSAAERRTQLPRLRKEVGRELKLATELFRIANRDSRIGFEASNHYFYLPRDLVEKTVNCRYLLQEVFAPGAGE